MTRDPERAKLGARVILALAAMVAISVTFSRLIEADTDSSRPAVGEGAADLLVDPPAGSGDPHSETHGSTGSSVPDTAPPTTQPSAVLEAELAIATSAIPGRTVEDAEREGYEVLGANLGGGAHLYREPEDLASLGTFDIASPAMVLATGGAASDQILALVYWVEDGDDGSEPPEGFTGSQDVWHRHRITCEIGGELLTGDDDPTLNPDTCRARHGTVISAGGWMLHVWCVPGVDLPPDGIFDGTH